MRKKKRNKYIRRISLVVVVLALVIAIIFGGDSLSPESIANWLSEKFSLSFGSEEYPISLPSGDVVSLDGCDNSVAVTNQTNVYFYSVRGKQLRSIQHSRKNVQTVCADDMLLVYAVGADEISVETQSKTLVSIKSEKKILFGDICESGSFIIASESDIYTSEMTVYDKNGVPIYRWTPSNGVISAVAISQDGKFVAASTVFTQGGKMLSGVHLFDISKDKAISSHTLQDEMVLSLYCNETGATAVCTEKMVYISAAKKKAVEYSFGEKDIIDYEECQSGIAFAFYDVNDPSKSVLEVVSKEGKLKSHTEIPLALKEISAYEDEIYAISGENLLKYDAATAVKIGSYQFSEEAEKITSTSAGAFVSLNSGKLEKIQIEEN
jgi:hypothetical protein